MILAQASGGWCSSCENEVQNVSLSLLKHWANASRPSVPLFPPYSSHFTSNHLLSPSLHSSLTGYFARSYQRAFALLLFLGGSTALHSYLHASHPFSKSVCKCDFSGKTSLTNIFKTTIPTPALPIFTPCLISLYHLPVFNILHSFLFCCLDYVMLNILQESSGLRVSHRMG